MLWALTNDDSMVMTPEYEKAVYDVFDSNHGLALVKVDPTAPDLIMGHQTKFRMGLAELPEITAKLITDSLKSLQVVAPYVFLVICGPGIPVSRHIHKDFLGVPAYQPVLVLKDGPVTGVTFGNNTRDLTSNRALFNVREWHWVEPQDSTTIWITPLGGKFTKIP